MQPVAVQPTRSLEILHVEDDPTFALIVKEKIGEAFAATKGSVPQHRADIDHAATLEEALHRLEDHWPDVIIADLNLPDSAGNDTILRLRGAAPDVPILVLTGLEDIEVGLTSAFEDAEFLSKDGLDADDLARRIWMAIARSATHARI